MTIENGGNYGVAAKGAGQIEIERVTIRASHGVGLAAEGLDRLVATEVEIVGPVDAESTDPPADDAATHGLLLIRIGEASLSAVSASRFAFFGAVLVDSSTTWEQGGTFENVVTNLLVSGGVASLQEIDVGRVVEQGLQLRPSYGAVFRSGARIDTTGLAVEECDGPGLVHDSADVRHVDLTARGNVSAGVWVQNTDGLEITGTSTIANNGLAGIMVVASSNVTVRGAQIDDTLIESRLRQVQGVPTMIEIGDGIQITDSTEGLHLEDLTLSDNERAGILIDLGGGSASDVSLSNVTVEGTDDQLGAIAQNGDVPDGWDSGISRLGDTGNNDLAVDYLLDVAEVIEPHDLPDADTLSAEGLTDL